MTASDIKLTRFIIEGERDEYSPIGRALAEAGATLSITEETDFRRSTLYRLAAEPDLLVDIEWTRTFMGPWTNFKARFDTRRV